MIRTWQKWAIGGLVALTLVIAGGLAILHANVDPGAYRSRIEALASRAVGRHVVIRGPIRLDLLPWPSVRMSDVEIANPGPVGQGPLARVTRVSVSPRPLALLAGRLAVGTVTIDGLSLSLARNQQGRTNWDGVIDAIAAGPGQALGAAKPADTTRVSTPGLPLSSMAVGAVRIEDARIDYDNAQSGRHWRLLDARLQTGRMTDGSPFRLEATGRFSRADSSTIARLHVVTLVEPHLSDRFYRFSDLGLNLLVDGPAIPGGEQEVNLGASGEIDFQAGRFGLDSVSLQTAGLSMSGKIDGTGLGRHLDYNGRITVAPFSPRSVMQQLEMKPPQTRAADALTQAGFDAQFEGGAGSVLFKQIAARLDDSHLTGTVRLTDFHDPRLHFDLALDTLDTDDYLPPGQRLPRAVEEDTNDGTVAIPWRVLRYASFSGRLSLGALTAGGMSVSQADLGLSAERNRLDLDALTAAAYGGRIDMAGSMVVDSGIPAYRLRGRLRHIAVGPLLADAVGSRPVEGTADIDLDLTTRGHEADALADQLDGTLALQLTDGQLTGYDLAAAIAAEKSAHHASRQDHAAATPIRSLVARFDINDGTALNQDLRLMAPRFDAFGQGQYRVPDNRFDYVLNVDVPPRTDGGLAGLAGRRVPVQLTGSLLAPKPRIGDARPLPARPDPSSSRGVSADTP